MHSPLINVEHESKRIRQKHANNTDENWLCNFICLTGKSTLDNGVRFSIRDSTAEIGR
jgi:hypothetical protein